MPTKVVIQSELRSLRLRTVNTFECFTCCAFPRSGVLCFVTHVHRSTWLRRQTAHLKYGIQQISSLCIHVRTLCSSAPRGRYAAGFGKYLTSYEGTFGLLVPRCCLAPICTTTSLKPFRPSQYPTWP